ncbi:MAG: TonB-dependent receptor [Alphaproteobacteria bacterium]|nr:MAG: TonB-dependent receptor [Alphaproteobacteria bacterium]
MRCHRFFMSTASILALVLPTLALGNESLPGSSHLEEIHVTATRTEKSAVSIPIKVNVFDETEIRLQQTLSTSPTEMLSKLVPSFSPGRQKLTGSGESFRGRRPLYLIDGVPQSNPLRDGRRDGFTIDPEVIERIEVVFGANAIQGLGATGGIVNYVTVSAPESGDLVQRASVSLTINDDFDNEGFGFRTHYSAAKKIGQFDVLGSISFESRGLQFDGKNRAIAVDNVQGDIADSDSRNFFAKLGWEPDDVQRVEFMFNDFRLAQDGDFESIDGDRDLGIPAQSVKGTPEGDLPVNDVTTMSLSYRNGDVAGGVLSAQIYYQDFSALFGGGIFGTFQDPAIAPVGTLFDQSENNSEKIGSRLTFARNDIADSGVDLITGFDILRDKTFQRLAQTDRNWVPVTKFINYAPFAQIDVNRIEMLSLSGGLRWEFAELKVPDFTTLAGNRDDFQPVAVEGGSPSFDEPLFNLGAVFSPTDDVRIYTSYAEAYSMPDVGRVLRSISEAGTSVDDFLNLAPIKTDNLEFGGAWSTDLGEIAVTYFESTSGFGSRLVANADGIFEVRRQATKTKGWEISGKLAPTSWLKVQAAYAILDGSFDGDGDGQRESDLGAADIASDRLNVALDITPESRFSGRIQSFTFFDKTFRDGTGAQTARFDGYTVVDASITADLEPVTVTFSVANLFDKTYITYFSQAATNRNDRYFAGTGRTFTLRAAARF